MQHVDQVYFQLVNDIIENGKIRKDRTGVGTRAVFGRQIRFNLQNGFPLLTTKKVHFKSVVGELLWFLSGSTNIEDLHQNNITIWDEWATDNGELGPVYGKQWRDWSSDPGNNGIDQIKTLVSNLLETPHSRRMVVSAWNPLVLPNDKISPSDNAKSGLMSLAPCHCLFQCYVEENRLSLSMYQRSVDVFLGLPFNIASYAALTHLLAHHTGMKAGDLIISLGDTHLYTNHLTDEIVYKQLKREPRKMPSLEITSHYNTLEAYQLGDFILHGYDPHPRIKAPIAV